MFNIEIRRSGNIKNIYRDVDKILGQQNLANGEVTESFKEQAIAQAFHKMLKPDAFLSICTIRDCAELAGICISKERMTIYHVNHCVHWSEMLPDFRKTLIAMILDDFRGVFIKDDIIDTTAVIVEDYKND